MKKLFAKIYGWLFGSHETKVQRKASKRTPKQHYGSHYYLGDLLDRLDAAFHDFHLMLNVDPDAHQIMKRIGATVCSSDGLIEKEVSSHVLARKPAFGFMYIGDDPSGTKDTDGRDMIPARFAWFVKERPTRGGNLAKRTGYVQPTNHDLYRCGYVYEMDGHVFATNFYVALSDTEVIPLKECYPKQYAMPRKKSRKGYHASPIVRMTWGYPQALVHHAEDHNTTPEELAKDLFTMAANDSVMRDAGLTVTVSKGGESCAFAIDMLRTPYFFADRNKTVNENGKTKPIIHIVKGHWRKSIAGKKFIKSHFRGLREFDWNGYSVRVGMAGWHGVAPSEFNFASENVSEENVNNPKYVNAKDAAERLQKVIA